MKTGLSKKVKIITAVACVLVTLAFLCVYSYGAFEISQINRNSNLTEELLQKKKVSIYKNMSFYPRKRWAAVTITFTRADATEYT